MAFQNKKRDVLWSEFFWVGTSNSKSVNWRHKLFSVTEQNWAFDGQGFFGFVTSQTKTDWDWECEHAKEEVKAKQSRDAAALERTRGPLSKVVVEKIKIRFLWTISAKLLATCRHHVSFHITQMF